MLVSILFLFFFHIHFLTVSDVKDFHAFKVDGVRNVKDCVLNEGFSYFFFSICSCLIYICCFAKVSAVVMVFNFCTHFECGSF